MHGHQLHGVLPGLRLVVARLERRMGQESRQRRQRFAGFGIGRQEFRQQRVGCRIQPLAGRRLAEVQPRAQLVDRQRHGVPAKAFLAHKRLGGVDQFGQIFQPVLAFLFELVMRFKPAVRQHQPNDFAQAHALGLLAQHIELGDKGAQVGAGLARHGADAVVQGTARGARNVLQLLDAARTDAARRKVDHAHEAGVVVRVLEQAQIGQRVLDLGALEKAQAAIDAVRHPGVEQRGFHDPALRIAAVQQRNLLALAAVPHQLLDLVDKPLGLGKIAGRLIHPHRLARSGLGAQGFSQPLAVVADQLVG